MKTTFNLLPLSSRIRFEHRRQLRLWMFVWLSAVGLLAVVHGLLETRHRGLIAALGDRETAAEPARQLLAEMQQLQRRSQAQREELQRLAGLAQADVPLVLLQVLGGACAAAGHEVQVDMLRVDETSVPLASTANGPAAVRKNLLISGKASVDSSLAGFVSALRGADVFRSVELESFQSGSQPEHPHRSFQIRCQMDCPPIVTQAGG